MTSQKSIRRLTDPLYFPSTPLENVSILNHSVYTSTTSSLFEFDIRNPSKIIHSESLSVLSTPEEISSIDQDSSSLIISTDDGDLLIISKSSKETRVRSSVHSNVIKNQLSCSKVFCEDLIVSGGFDCRVMLTGLNGEIISGVSLEDLFPSQGFNPPHVYAISCRQREVAFALGNGNVCVFEYGERLTGKVTVQAHQQRVMALALVKFDDFGISADVDEICFWKEKVFKKVVLAQKVSAI
jgi:hypothetical protein